jgi:hypothetical protein
MDEIRIKLIAYEEAFPQLSAPVDAQANYAPTPLQVEWLEQQEALRLLPTTSTSRADL